MKITEFRFTFQLTEDLHILSATPFFTIASDIFRSDIELIDQTDIMIIWFPSESALKGLLIKIGFSELKTRLFSEL